jgi:hypothetical protein
MTPALAEATQIVYLAGFRKVNPPLAWLPTAAKRNGPPTRTEPDSTNLNLTT